MDHMGSDLTVVNAARVSFDKESAWEIPVEQDDNGIDYQDWDNPVLKQSDDKLVKYLAEHEHWSPSAHPHLMFRIKAPIFVARQLAKHQVGFAWNEVSRRYVDSKPEFYYPEHWRKKAEDKKQGSSEDVVKYFNPPGQTRGGIKPQAVYMQLINYIEEFYEDCITNNVCPEQARMILPQSMYTEWIWTGSLYAFARMLNLRLKDDTQKETREIALQIKKHVVDLFPVSSKYLLEV